MDSHLGFSPSFYLLIYLFTFIAMSYLVGDTFVCGNSICLGYESTLDTGISDISLLTLWISMKLSDSLCLFLGFEFSRFSDI